MRSNAIRLSARDEACTFEIVGVCNGDPSTTVLCHLPNESHGMGRKSDDISAAYGCSACHDVIDRRSCVTLPPHEAEWYMRRAMVRTWLRLIEKGVVRISGVRP